MMDDDEAEGKEKRTKAVLMRFSSRLPVVKLIKHFVAGRLTTLASSHSQAKADELVD